MTKAQMRAIAIPVEGLIVYETDSKCLCSYSNGSWTGCYMFSPGAPLGAVAEWAVADVGAIVNPIDEDGTIPTISSSMHGNYYKWGDNTYVASPNTSGLITEFTGYARSAHRG